MGWSWMRKLFEAWYSDVGTVLLMARLKQGRRKDDRPVWALDRAGRESTRASSPRRASR
jgi:hypothetical protein